MNTKSLLAVVLILSGISAPAPGFARTWHIKSDGTGDAPTIQAGVDSAAVTDTVSVAPGTYSHSTEVLIGGVVKKVNVHLYKNIFLIAEDSFHNTVLDFSDNDHAVYINGTESALLKGFHIYLLPDWGGYKPPKGHSVYCASGCAIEFNLVRYNFYGTAIYIHDDSAYPKIVRGNVLLHNYAGVHVCASKVTVENNTVFSDTSVEFGVGVFFSPDCASELIIQNNILVWGSRAIDCYPACDPGAFMIRCNGLHETILDADRGSASFALDPSNFDIPWGNPQFCGAGAGNFYLQSDSPCAPGNHPRGYDCGFVGAYPVNCGTTPAERSTWGNVKSLYE